MYSSVKMGHRNHKLRIQICKTLWDVIFQEFLVAAFASSFFHCFIRFSNTSKINMYALIASAVLYLGFWKTAITKCLPVALCAFDAYHRRYVYTRHFILQIQLPKWASYKSQRHVG